MGASKNYLPRTVLKTKAKERKLLHAANSDSKDSGGRSEGKQIEHAEGVSDIIRTKFHRDSTAFHLRHQYFAASPLAGIPMRPEVGEADRDWRNPRGDVNNLVKMS